MASQRPAAQSAPTKNNSVDEKPVDSDSPIQASSTGSPISLLDIIRVIALVVVAGCGLSYYTTNGDSLLFGQRPWFTRPDVLKQYLKGEVLLTPKELARYDGTDSSLPVYLALNGTIYDVSAGRRTYGPGGSYQYFAGRDSTRGYVTGCFAQDTTGDLRGVEDMYMPIDDPEDEEEQTMTNAEKKIRREKERREGKKKVQQEVEKWAKFYENSKKYFKVGRVVGPQEYSGDPPELCAQAMKARPKRKKKKSVKEEL